MSNIDMSNLGRELLRGGVTPKYVRRTLFEIDSHFQDIKEQIAKDGSSESDSELLAWEEIGDESAILKEALSKPELKSLAWRFPKAVLLLGPTLIYFASAALFFFFLFISFSIFPSWMSLDSSSSPSALTRVGFEIVVFFLLYIAPLCIGIFIALYVKRRLIQGYLPVIGIVTMTIIGSGWAYEIDWPTASAQGAMSFNWGYSFLPTGIRGDHDIQNYFQILLALFMAFVSWSVYKPNESYPLFNKTYQVSHHD